MSVWTESTESTESSESTESTVEMFNKNSEIIPQWARSAPVDERQLATVGVWNPSGVATG